MRRSADTEAPAGLADLGCACAMARRAARAITQLYDRHLRESEVEGAQFALLSVVNAIGPCSQAMIGGHFALDKTTLSRNLKVLKRKGWVEAVAADDRRERRYVLSGTGRARLAAAKPAWRRAQEHLRSSMSAGEWEAMWKTLQMVTQAAHSARRSFATQSATPRPSVRKRPRGHS